MTLDTGLAARLVAGIRANTPGATPWDAPGIAAALREVGGSPGAAFAAAALAAEDAALAKPSAAAFRVHWPQNVGVSAPRRSMDIPCPDHPTQVHPCPTCRDEKPPLTPEAIAELKAVALEAKTRAPRPKFGTSKREAVDRETAREDARRRADAEVDDVSSEDFAKGILALARGGLDAPANQKCESCGGDTLRPNFTGDGGLCHAGGTPYGEAQL